MHGSGPALVLLHGFTASSVAFSRNIPELARRFTVVALDLPGHGDSDAPAAGEAYEADAIAARLDQFFDDLGLDELLICGHALGGALALRYAIEQPGRVAGAVLINSTAAVAGPGWREAARPGIEAFAARVRAEGAGWLLDSPMSPLRAQAIPAGVRARLAGALQSASPHALVAMAERLAVDINVPELLPALESPTLVVIGQRDHEFAGHVDGFLRRAPQGIVTTTVLPGAGHAANIEDPSGFHEALFGFAEAIGYLQPAVSWFGRGNALVGAGATLMVGGFALLGAALFFGTEEATPAASPIDQPTQVAGERATGTVAATRSPGSVVAPTRPSASPAPGTMVAATEPATAEPSSTQTAEPTEAPSPATEPSATLPPASPTPAPSPTVPAGPFAAISGPAQVDPGVPVTFKNASGGGAILGQSWSVLGSSGNLGPAATVTFPSAGCYSVAITTFFAGGLEASAAMSVSVGGASCP